MGRLLWISVVCCASLLAQETTGSVTGLVRDPSGSVVAGATVILSNTETGAEFRVVTSESGDYSIPLVRAGQYRLVLEAPGFQRLQRDGIQVNTTERLRIDLTLTVGQVTETVNVTAETPLLQGERATMGQVVEQRTIQSIPLATRNFTQILGVSAGVVGSVFNADNPGTGSDSVSVNGARRGSNNLLVDGVPTTNPLNNAPDGDGTPSIEFLSEFRVMTSLYSAEYGRNLGSTINVTTRSGSNAFHGAAYEYLRNTKLNARPFFNPSRGQNNQNQFGANIGGPFTLPKLYSGKDRTFFFVGWESSRQRNANSNDASIQRIVPTLAQRRGDFSGLRADGRQLPIIRDPATGQPFPGNIIPTARLNPISLGIQDKYIPLPNFASGANNFFAASSIKTDIDMWTLKMDHRFSSNDSISGRWFESFQGDVVPFGQGLPGFGRTAKREKHSGNVTHTHVFGAAQVLEARFGFDDTSQFLSFENADDPTAVGLRPLATTNKEGMPRIVINNYVNGFGNSENWSDFIKRYTMGATMTWISGRHNAKYGVESQISDYNPKNALNNRGRWDFTGLAAGDEYADFLLSQPRIKYFTGPAQGGELKMRDNLLSFFFTDDWKVSQRLSVNWGVRYEYQFQPAAYNLKMVNWWPENYRGVGSLESSGIVQGEVNGVPKSTVYNDANNFAPRVGIAFRPTDAWVIRAGAGLYFDTRTGQIAQQAFNNPPTATSVTPDCNVPGTGCTLTSPDNWTYIDPGYDPSRIPFPTRASDQVRIWGTERNVKLDNAWQYNFSLQRQFRGNWLVETAYVGTKGTNLMARRNFNPLIPQTDGTLARQYPGFGDLLVTAQNGSSSYHSFQTTVKKRTRLTTLQAAYTFGKTLGNGDDNARFFTSMYPTPWNDFSRAKGPANFDRTHRLTVVLNQDLPSVFASGFGKVLLNNWSLNTFFVSQTGTPITVFNRDSGQALGGIATDPTGAFFADVVSGVPLVTPGDIRNNLRNYINPAAFVRAPRTRYGNSGRGMLRGPGQTTVDLSIFKDFRFRERFGTQFRTEVFNLLNHANFSNPGNNMDSGNFGQITSTSVNARLIQMALRFTF